MITKFKIYENDSKLSYDDYVICKSHNSELNSFFRSNVGKIYTFPKDKNYIRVEFYKTPPYNIETFFTRIPGYHRDSYTIKVGIDDIIYRSTNKSELEKIVKYNL